MFKYVEYALADNNDQYVHLVHPSHGLTKTAAAGFGPDLEAAVANLKREEGKTYLLVNALSSGEYYGPNKNADYFPEKALMDHHKSFEEFGYVYKHHKNHDPKRSYGRAVFSHYNPVMKRVELIISLDNKKAHDILDRIDRGQNAYVSMGCKVPFDYCSICNNAAKTRAQYCDHMKTMPGKTLPDGRKVYVINKKPRFFDISFVTIPADRTAGFMAKLGSTATVQEPEVTLSADIADEVLKSASEIKEAVINKKILAKVEGVSEDPLALIRDTQKDIPPKVLKKLAEQYPLNEILSTFQGARLMPTDRDFQRLVLYSSGNEKLANYFDQTNQIFSTHKCDKPKSLGNVGLEFFNEKIASEISPLITERSLSKPLVMARSLKKLALYIHPEIPLPPSVSTPTGPGALATSHDEVVDTPGMIQNAKEKIFGKDNTRISPYKNPVFALSTLNALYLGFKALFDSAVANPLQKQSLDALLRRNPALLVSLIGGVSGLSALAQQNMSKTASAFIVTSLMTVPATYMYSGHQEARKRRGEEIGSLQNFIRKHPFLSSTLGLAATSPLWKLAEHTSKLASELNSKDFNNLYNSVVGISY